MRVGREQDIALLELLEDKAALIAQEDFVLCNSMREDIEQLMLRLNQNEKEVLSLRFGLDNGISLSLAEVGQRLELSRERIRQIETKALNKLRQQKAALEGYQ